MIYAGRAQRNYPMEFIEAEFPVRVERYAIRPDSGGPGLHRGGVGMVREYRVLAEEIVLATRMANLLVPPWGVKGGSTGRTGHIVLNPGMPEERAVPGFADGVTLRRGDLLRVVSHGGGGYGDPLERAPARVLDDVADGFVSIAGARTDYGVVVDAGSLTLDAEATRRLRAERRTGLPAARVFFERGGRFAELENARRQR